MKSQKLVVASLVEDFSLYPRNHVDTTHVGDLVRALHAGVALPPIIAEAKSLRIVDGVHRRRAYLKFGGDNVVAVVDLRTYRNDAALFLDAVALNSAHGRKLDRHDQTRIILRLRELHVPDEQIAVTLHVPEPSITTLALRIVHGPDGEAVPLKRGMEYLRGETLSTAQVNAMGSVRSAEAGRLCVELLKLLQNNLVDLTNEEVRRQLASVRDSITLALKKSSAA